MDNGSEPKKAAQSVPDPPPLAQKGPMRDFGFLPIPAHCRFDPAKPPELTLALNLFFGLGATVTVSLLYYNQPLLVKMSDKFEVTYDGVSRIPTLTQAGYATGLLLISPVGDLVRRRPLLIVLVLVSTAFTIGLAVVDRFHGFEALSFLAAVFTVSPQVLIPLSADLAKPERRATAISITLSGLLLGVLFARLVAGIVAQYASFRVVYWLAVGLQTGLAALFWLLLPDVPNKSAGTDLTYLKILYTMLKFALTEPVLIQGCLISCAASAHFVSFWVTLTFLLTDIYHYSTLDIGLWALIGMVGIAVAVCSYALSFSSLRLTVATKPFSGRIIDSMNPWLGCLIGLLILLVAGIVQIVGAGLSIAAVVISTVLIDVGAAAQQTANAARIFQINPAARARLNGVFVLFIFVGQVIGSLFGTTMYTKYGWRAPAALNLGWVGFELFVLFLRGPHQRRAWWVGWGGKYSVRKTPPARAPISQAEKAEEPVEGEKDVADAEQTREKGP